ncbi:hypothetical protein HNQ91_003985 [Filimonas zeae]|uniref:hypothetical protein n=1 Tax=Filimonas zeae TaxID=1737353 RepID=UPI001669B4F1|nr:hypothetical protein [Filimonas zeae]MDR6340912.1 hypothetical protein [Filimonas zeae]
MKKTTLLLIVLMWFALYLVQFSWLFMLLALFMLTIVEIVKTVRERRQLSKQRLLSLFSITTLFLLTMFDWNVSRWIEQADRAIFNAKRQEVVEQIKSGQLKPASKGYFRLPYSFPCLSSGGNLVWITRSENNQYVTVRFDTKNMFSSYSANIQLVYTNDPEVAANLEGLTELYPVNNWKVRSNWYRTYSNY